MTDLTIFIPTELTDESFQEFLPSLFEELQEDFGLIEGLNRSCDYMGVRRLAHKIKGSAACYGAVLISDKAKLLHEIVDSNKEQLIDQHILNLKQSIETSRKYAQKEFGLTH